MSNAHLPIERVKARLVGVNELAWYVHTWVLPAALALLPGKMDTPQARAEMLAIGYQESGFVARQQGGTKKTPGQGPAKSFWQFERMGGVAELLDTPSTAAILTPICDLLGYPRWTPTDLHEAMEHNDVLAAVMARLLLYRDPRQMPESNEIAKGWEIYVARWRPGKPHPQTWPAHFAAGWEMVRA